MHIRFVINKICLKLIWRAITGLGWRHKDDLRNRLLSSHQHWDSACDLSRQEFDTISHILSDLNRNLFVTLLLLLQWLFWLPNCLILCAKDLIQRVNRSIFVPAGLITTVAFRLGKGGPTHFALEGSIAECGSGLDLVKRWGLDPKLVESATSSEGQFIVVTSSIFGSLSIFSGNLICNLFFNCLTESETFFKSL